MVDRTGLIQKPNFDEFERHVREGCRRPRALRRGPDAPRFKTSAAVR